ncbi:dienelactone hydrolase family protein [Alcanivorax sp. DP30]|uniref:dienelactone hydrolase family protein n=1 Tax=Alcanivorax sp. DP30 TaxID=2606217 RepID=UPI0013712ABC|nr:dienelactone hydrolase family protein [Alcanivorax sp. DP30]MZR63765.1 prolyl oligopeptidase family serine peptidase [Alcanivorax sp. DP30]
MKRLGLFILFLVMGHGARADIIETRVTLPDNLGTGVMYLNDKQKEPSAGVIVVHEWWGLNDYARDRARLLAKEGFVALAVDMYGTGKVATHPKDATAFMETALAEPEKMNARFEAARKMLLKQQQVDPKRVFAIGYCFGGAVVLNQARSGADLAGVASFHGSLGTKTPAKAGEIKAKVLVATGQADPMVPAEQVSQFVTEMTAAGVDLRLLSFPGVKHSFTNPGADAVAKRFELPVGYDAHADLTSWDALMDFMAD